MTEQNLSTSGTFHFLAASPGRTRHRPRAVADSCVPSRRCALYGPPADARPSGSTRADQPNTSDPHRAALDATTRTERRLLARAREAPRLLSVTSFPVSLRLRPAEFTAAD